MCLMSLVVLQATLDSFAAVQYLPANLFIHIESNFGISTIVVWAHHVLGLTVCVEGDNSTVRFGNGFDSVVIEARSGGETKPSLLNAVFQVTDSADDLPLEVSCQHPVIGYGTRVLELQNFHSDIESERTKTSDVDRREKNMYPSAQRIVAVGKSLF